MALEIEERNPSKLDQPVACYARGCRLRNVKLVEATRTTFTVPGERTARKAISFAPVANKVTMRDILRLTS